MTTQVHKNVKLLKDWLFYQEATWVKKFAWTPKRCDQSKKLIWLTYGYCGSSLELLKFNTGTVILEKNVTRWLCKDQFIIFALSKQYN